MIRFLVALVVLVAPALSQTPPAPERRALIISVDGLRPDVMLRADAPTLRGLIEQGAFTCWAQTTAVAVTLPSHVSMLTGAKPQRHKIEWNSEMPFSKPVYPATPTIFELARKAGYSTALVAAKTKFRILAKPGAVDDLWVPTEDGEDDEDVSPDDQVLQHAIQLIEEKTPQLLFVHFGSVDGAGHGKGWGSPQQLEAIHAVDARIGKLIDTLKARKLFDSTLLIISADHGGAGRSHGADDVRSRHIPWIAVGPGVRRGYDLTRDRELTIKTEDTFATACAWLKIPLPSRIDGAPVKVIFEEADKD